jgi:hypothetical protein
MTEWQKEQGVNGTLPLLGMIVMNRELHARSHEQDRMLTLVELTHEVPEPPSFTVYK